MTLNEAIEILTASEVDSPIYDAREIFRHFGGSSQSDLITRRAESDKPEVISAIMRRAKREPLQYIIGRVDFYRESYTVTPDCLIPRQDTEVLVDYLVKNLPEGANFIDICTGSGCIAISTLKNTKNTRAVAVDISENALAVAEKNAKENGVFDLIDFVCADALMTAVEGEFYAVVANPPYVTESAYRNLADEIFHEPKIAFVAEENGVVFYRRLTPMYKNRLHAGGFIAYEIGYDQADLVRAIADENQMKCRILKDLSGNDRVAILEN